MLKAFISTGDEQRHLLEISTLKMVLLTRLEI